MHSIGYCTDILNEFLIVIARITNFTKIFYFPPASIFPQYILYYIYIYLFSHLFQKINPSRFTLPYQTSWSPSFLSFLLVRKFITLQTIYRRSLLTSTSGSLCPTLSSCAPFVLQLFPPLSLILFIFHIFSPPVKTNPFFGTWSEKWVR